MSADSLGVVPTLIVLLKHSALRSLEESATAHVHKVTEADYLMEAARISMSVSMVYLHLVEEKLFVITKWDHSAVPVPREHQAMPMPELVCP